MDEMTVKIKDFPEPVKTILSKGERVDLIPAKEGGVKVFRVRREEVKAPNCMSCKSWNRCINAARTGNLIRCAYFGYMQKHSDEK